MPSLPSTQRARLSAGRPARPSGFTLVELSVVLVIIGLIVGAVSVGKDVQRNAVYQRIANDYVNGWAMAYDRFYDGSGRPPGDNAAVPTGMVQGQTATPLCGLALRTAMQAAGVDLPAGRATGAEDRYVYLDSNGNPQELSICFSNVAWSEPGAAPGAYVTRNRNVMVINNLTPALANLIDSSVDGAVDAGLGKLRQDTQSANGGVSVAWSADETVAFGAAASTGRDEDQVAVVSARLKMLR